MSRRYYFIAIGGIGMSALAHILLDRGLMVVGSDTKQSAVTDALERAGAKIFYGQKSAHVEEGDFVIYSTIMREDNPDMINARAYTALGSCKMMHRAQFLELELAQKKALVITGAHGKTTTTALLAHLLQTAQLNPSFVVGGVAPSLVKQGKEGSGEYFVAEGDESDGSFLKCLPYAAIVTNVDDDHLAYWKTREALHEGYHQFMERVISQEHIFWYAEDPFMSKWHMKGPSFGLSEKADIRASNMRLYPQKCYFDLDYQGQHFTDIELGLSGEHNVLNSLGVIGMALMIGLSFEEIRLGLKSFKGVKRRLEFLGESDGVKVFDDYAHHPKEIQATLAVLDSAKGRGRLVAVFQPHRYTRTQELYKEFIEVLSGVEHLILTDIYSAGESPIEGITTEALLKEMPEGPIYVPYNRLTHFLKGYLTPEDTMVTLGAGDITAIGPELLRADLLAAK